MINYFRVAEHSVNIYVGRYVSSQYWNYLDKNSLMKTYLRHLPYHFLNPGSMVSCPEHFPWILGLPGGSCLNTVPDISVESFSEDFYLGKN